MMLNKTFGFKTCHALFPVLIYVPPQPPRRKGTLFLAVTRTRFDPVQGDDMYLLVLRVHGDSALNPNRAGGLWGGGGQQARA